MGGWKGHSFCILISSLTKMLLMVLTLQAWQHAGTASFQPHDKQQSMWLETSIQYISKMPNDLEASCPTVRFLKTFIYVNCTKIL